MESQPLAATPLAQMESFEALLGVQVTLYDFAHFFQIGDRRFLPGVYGAHDRCGFCRLVKDDFGRLRDCLRCDMEPIVSRSRGPAAWRRCHAGVWEVVYPLWDGATFIGALMAGCFRRSGESALLEAPMERRGTVRTEGRLPIAQSGPTALRQHHRALRELDTLMEKSLPALVENFGLGLVRTMAALRRSESLVTGAIADVSAESGGGNAPRQERHRAIELYFRTHLAAGTQIAGLAEYLHLSVARTSQILRRELKTTFPALLRQTRLAEAKRLLVVSDLSIGRIAEVSGFDDRNYFCRVFTKALGQTPTEYRRIQAKPLRA